MSLPRKCTSHGITMLLSARCPISRANRRSRREASPRSPGPSARAKAKAKPAAKARTKDEAMAKVVAKVMAKVVAKAMVNTEPRRTRTQEATVATPASGTGSARSAT